MAMLIDVRTPEEYAERHAAQAINIPLADIQSGNLGPLASVGKDTSLHLHCRSGARSESARALLVAAGFTDVTNIGGLEEAMRE